MTDLIQLIGTTRPKFDVWPNRRSQLNPRTYPLIYTPTVVQGGGGHGTPPRSFWYVAVFWNDFTFTFDHLNKMRYILLVVALLCFTWKITHKQALCMILATRFTFMVERSWKNMYFHTKLAWPHATYDVISRDHSNWPSLNLSQNPREGWANSFWQRQVLIFYPLGKNSEKPYGGGIHPNPPPPLSPPLYVRGLI